MADEKPKVPEYIAEHKKHLTYAKKFLDTQSKYHTEAYNSAIDKHLMDDGLVNFEKLEDSKTQLDFAKTMTEFYITKARAQYKIDPQKNLNKMERELLLQAYAGITEGQLTKTVSQYGKQFNHSRWQEESAEFSKAVRGQIYAAAGSHLNESNINDIIKYTGLEGKVQNLDLREATSLLQIHHDEGAVPDQILKQLPKYKVVKPKPRDERQAA